MKPRVFPPAQPRVETGPVQFGDDFQPDYNIEFNAARGNPPSRHQPSGTNLFGSDQAQAMVRYMVEGMPADKPKGNDNGT